MGTTVVAALVEDAAADLHGVGDSRIYSCCRGELSQLTPTIHGSRSCSRTNRKSTRPRCATIRCAAS